jgi:hypothetical protein
MPITIDVYSEEATRLFAPSDEHEVFTSVPIPGHADSLALLRRAFPESVYALERLFAAPEGQYGRRELVFDADNRERLLMGLHVASNGSASSRNSASHRMTTPMCRRVARTRSHGVRQGSKPG